MVRVLKFTLYQNRYYWCNAFNNNNSGEYVSLSDYQSLETQYRTLVDSAGAGILSLVEQRKELKSLLKRWNEIAPELTIKLTSRSTNKTYKTLNLELSQLIQDTSEAIK